MNAHEHKNYTAEPEELTGDERKIVELLGGLTRVNAPGDFDFRVKAKIAARSESGSIAAPRFRPIYLAAPTGLLVAVGAFFGLSGFLSTAEPRNDVVESNKTQNVMPEPIVTSPPVVEPEVAVDVRQSAPRSLTGSTAPATAGATQRRITPAVNSNRGGGGSFQRAVSVTNPIILPGANSNSVSPRASNEDRTPTAGEIKIVEVLKAFGIDAEATSTGWRVRSTMSNSPAAQSGLKTGDLIEAVDDRPINETTVVTGSFKAGKLKVLREGKRIDVVLTNQ